MRWLPCFCFLVPFSYNPMLQQPGARPPRPSEAKVEPRTPPRLDAKGAEWLKNAATAFGTKQRPWIAAKVWQQVDVNGVFFRADGDYLTGPEQRLRTNLTLHGASSRGTMLRVSDGSTLWDRVEFGGSGESQITRINLRSMREALSNPGVPELLRIEFWQTGGFMGVAPLLEQIQKQMTVTNHEMIRWRDRDVVKLTAFWSEGVERTLVAPDKPWPTFLPRKCYLYLDATDRKSKNWPYRIEWWGPAPPLNVDQLLVQTEFRDPKIDEPLSVEEMARAFHFDPGTAKVEDLTEQLLSGIKNSAPRRN